MRAGTGDGLSFTGLARAGQAGVTTRLSSGASLCDCSGSFGRVYNRLVQRHRRRLALTPVASHQQLPWRSRRQQADRWTGLEVSQPAKAVHWRRRFAAEAVAELVLGLPPGRL